MKDDSVPIFSLGTNNDVQKIIDRVQNNKTSPQMAKELGNLAQSLA